LTYQEETVAFKRYNDFDILSYTITQHVLIMHTSFSTEAYLHQYTVLQAYKSNRSFAFSRLCF